MQTVPHVLGIAHPTGYPTYVLLAWAAQLVPIGSVAFRANLLSAVVVAAALAAVAASLCRLGVRRSIAAAAALALGAVGTVWSAATVAEVNPLHLLLMSLLLLFSLRWADRRHPRDLIVGGLLVGLSAGNHLLTLFVAPFLIAYTVWAGRADLRRRPWVLGAAVAATVAGLSVYLYIPLAALRDPPLAYNHPVTLDSVLWLITGEQFRYQFDLFSPKGPGEFFASLPELVGTAIREATPVLPIAGLVGLPILVLRRRAFGLACVGILVTGLFVWATYQRLEHYLLVPFMILAIGAGVTADAAASVLGRAFARNTPQRDEAREVRLGQAVAAITLVFVVVLAGLNWANADRSGEHSGDDYVSAVFEALPANAAVVSYWDPAMPLFYGHFVEGRRPDVLIVDDSNIVYEGWGDALHRIVALICERPVFLMRISEADLAPIRIQYRLTEFMTVRSSALGPTAVLDQVIFRVEPDRPCGGSG